MPSTGVVEASPPPSLRRVQRRTMRVLVSAQLLGAVGLAAGGTAGALLARALTGSAAAAGLPLALLVLGSGISALVITRIMGRYGRRAGLTTGHLSGALGAGLVVAAASLRDLPLLLVGCALLGGGNAAVMLARYAAADLSGKRGRSMGTIVVAASAGAIAGPNLLGPSGGLAVAIGLPATTGLFLLAIPAFISAALVLTIFLRPDPLLLARTADPPATPKGTWTSVLANRQARLGVLVLSVANLTMVAVMAVAPLQLHAHHMGLGLVGLMISAHIAAMYLPSPLSGALAESLGGRKVAAAGALLLLASGGLAGSGSTMTALILLGVGWNFGLIGGSTLLREANLESSQQTRAEGLGELGMGTAAALGGGSAGAILAAGGFATLSLIAATPCLLLLAVLALGVSGGDDPSSPALRRTLNPDRTQSSGRH